MRSIETQRLPDKYENPSFEIMLDNDTCIKDTDIENSDLEVRVFNEDFVRDNLHFLINPDGVIEPFAILGSNNAEVEKAIRKLENEIGSDIEGNETGLYKQFKDSEKTTKEVKEEYSSLKDELNDKLSKKATDRKKGIKYNSEKFGDLNYHIGKIREEIKIVISTDYVSLTQEKKKKYEEIVTERPKDNIDILDVPNLHTVEYSEKARRLLATQLGESSKIYDLMHDVALNQWVKEGQKLLAGKETCSFCGNLISSERWAEINMLGDGPSISFKYDLN